MKPRRFITAIQRSSRFCVKTPEVLVAWHWAFWSLQDFGSADLLVSKDFNHCLFRITCGEKSSAGCIAYCTYRPAPEELDPSKVMARNFGSTFDQKSWDLYVS